VLRLRMVISFLMLLIFGVGFTANAMMPHFEESSYESAIDSTSVSALESEMHSHECEDVTPHDFCSWGFCHWGHCSFNVPLSFLKIKFYQVGSSFNGAASSIYEDPALQSLRRPPKFLA